MIDEGYENNFRRGRFFTIAGGAQLFVYHYAIKNIRYLLDPELCHVSQDF
jgi:hypothetical protein